MNSKMASKKNVFVSSFIFDLCALLFVTCMVKPMRFHAELVHMVIGASNVGKATKLANKIIYCFKH